MEDLLFRLLALVPYTLGLSSTASLAGWLLLGPFGLFLGGVMGGMIGIYFDATLGSFTSRLPLLVIVHVGIVLTVSGIKWLLAN